MIEKKMTKPQWIKIESEKDLPVFEEKVLASEGKNVFTATLYKDERMSCSKMFWLRDEDKLNIWSKVKYWKKLPEPPEES